MKAACDLTFSILFLISHTAVVARGPKTRHTIIQDPSNATKEYEGIKAHNTNIIKKLRYELNRQKKTGNEQRTDVIIGGAGWSGVTTANILADALVDFNLVEATDDIGGRMKNTMFGAGNPKYSIELGAQWIDGISLNPAYAIAEEVDLGGEFDSFGYSFYDELGNRDVAEENYEYGTEHYKVDWAYYLGAELTYGCLQPSLGDTILRWYRNFCDNKLNNGETFIPMDDDDMTEEDAWFKATGYKVDNRPRAKQANGRAWQTFYVDFNHGVGPKKISANNSQPSYEYYDFGSGDYWVGDHRGYRWLPKYQASTFLNTSLNTNTNLVFDDDRLHFQRKILVVEWDPEGIKDVNITVCNTKKVTIARGQDRYPCRNDSTIVLKGNEFVSTFSNQVLKKSLELEQRNASLMESRDIAPRFIPPLSSIDGMNDVLPSIELGLYTKLFFQFKEKFWPQGRNYYVSAATGETSGAHYIGNFASLWFDLDKRYEGSNFFMLYTFGDRAKELSNSTTDEEAMEQVLPVLSAMFRDDILETFGVEELTSDHVSDFLMTRWTEDPLFYGGWEVAQFGIPYHNNTVLRSRHGNLIFSGSYSCRRHIGHTSGAFLSGYRAGLNLLKERYGFEDLDASSLCDTGFPP